MELTTPVLQIVGFQNSGKTTLVTKIIETMSASGIRVGTIKHHGHGGMPDSYDTDKDTAKHRRAGATVTGVEGAGMLQLHAFNGGGWTLLQMLSFYNNLPLDIILIEGFKREPFPKVVLLRSEEDEVLLEQLENIQVVISWYKRLETKIGYPIFQINDEHDYLSWVQSYFERIDLIE
ncbi:MAG TPA: molybdopterin-guanine dinucleotide biosynthesis protein B [Bacillales bacterium]|nr:molybdopterin-guanine dinucleotide biosynthesis protein B [Bacillales bacterium]